MYLQKHITSHYKLYHKALFRQEKKIATETVAILSFLLLAEGHAVGALVHSGVCLVGTHHDPLQGAVVCFIAMVHALGNGALDALVGIVVHDLFLLFFVMLQVCPQTRKQSKFYD